MLNVFRRHGEACPLKGKRRGDGRHGKGYCPLKPPCRIYVEGIDGTGKNHPPHVLKDPDTSGTVRDWNRACEIVRAMELPTPPAPVQKPKTPLHLAIEGFLALKAKRDTETRRKYANLLKRLRDYCESELQTSFVDDVAFTDLIGFRNTWKEANSTQINQQTMLKAFFKFCVRADYIVKNPAEDLDPIPEDKAKTAPFEPDEMQRIFAALPNLTDQYGRRGDSIAKQTKAFVYVMRYTGMSIGDTTTLEKSHVSGCRIRTYRKKTGEDVYGRVPQFVIEALNEAPHDSRKYFFWSGEGNSHTRTNKWGERLQRLFVLADVKVVEVEKKRRSGGKLKTAPQKVRVSAAKPHMFRHTLARDLLLGGTPMEELAELLGNSVRIIEKYYSKWDTRRQARLEEHLETFWKEDPLTKTLNEAQTGPVQ
jgi:integrase